MVLRKIKILFTIPNFTTAGSGREMFNIIERLDKNVYDVTIAVRAEGGKLFDEIKAKGYPVLVTEFSAEGTVGVVKTIIQSIRISRTFSHYNFDVWQSFNWSSDYSEALIARLSGAKYVYVKKNMNWQRRAWKLKSFLAKAIVVRNTTMLKRFFSTKQLRHKAYFIPGGVNVASFSREHTYDVRQQYNISKDAFVIVCVAQLVRVKDQATLIRAVKDIEAVHLVLAGAERDANYAKEIRNLTRELELEGRVIISGNVADIRSLLHNSNLFVLPTSMHGGHEEGYPVALLEAMAAGVPCIASNVAGSNDLIIDEETGLLFEPGNVEDLMRCISRCMTDSLGAASFATSAKDKVTTNNTLEIEANAFSTLYKSMAYSK